MEIAVIVYLCVSALLVSTAIVTNVANADRPFLTALVCAVVFVPVYLLAFGVI